MKISNLKLAFILFSFIILSSICSAQKAEDESGGKISGYMFGDFYYNIDHHNHEIKDQDGFWFRRIYFTYDYRINKSFSTRLRLEMNNEGDYASSKAMIPFVKDAYLEYKFNLQKAYFGITPPPTFNLIEKFWGYRSVEKTALDQQRMASSRDFGLALKGQFDRAGKFEYHTMIGNGSGNKQEIDKGKSFMTSISYWPTKEIVFQVYGDYADRSGEADTYIGQVFLGYKSKILHGGIQFSHQQFYLKDETSEGVDCSQPWFNCQLNILSVFLAGNITEKIKLLGRMDRMFEPNPFGDEVDYTPFDTQSSFFLFIGGVDVQVVKNVSIIPNIQYVKYDANYEGITPSNDIYGRLTFYWKFK